MAFLSIIIVTYNSAAEIVQCITSIQQKGGKLDVEVVVIDNASRDDTVERVRVAFRNVRVVANTENIGFPAANNQGFALTTGEYLLMLNPDTVVHPGALEQMVEVLEREPEVAICGPKLVDEKGVIAGDVAPVTLLTVLKSMVGLDSLSARVSAKKDPAAVSGAALLLRRKLLSEVGTLDEDMFWGEDADLCVRARSQGWKIRHLDTAVITHYVGRSAASNLGLYLEKQYTSKIRFLCKHAGRLEFWACLPALRFSAASRWLKWRALSVFAPSAEACVRVDVLRRLVAQMPLLFQEEMARRLAGISHLER